MGVTIDRIASDFYHHFKEDIALMAEMGFKVYRMSISWARYPNGIEENPKKKVYNSMMTCLMNAINMV